MRRRMMLLETRLQLTVADFDVIRRLGEGSFSTVILARYKQDGREYAVKMINKNLVLRNKVRSDLDTEWDWGWEACKTCSVALLANYQLAPCTQLHTTPVIKQLAPAAMLGLGAHGAAGKHPTNVPCLWCGRKHQLSLGAGLGEGR